MNDEERWHKILDPFLNYPDILKHCGACTKKCKPKFEVGMTFPCGGYSCRNCSFAKKLKKEGWCF